MLLTFCKRTANTRGPIIQLADYLHFTVRIHREIGEFPEMDFSVLQRAGSGYKGSDNFSPEPDPHLPSLFNLGNKILLQNVAITLCSYNVM